MRLLLSIGLLLWLLLPLTSIAAAADVESRYQTARDALYQLQNSARKQMYRDQWQKVLNLFEQVYERYPGSARADDAWFMSGKTAAQLYQISRVKKDARLAVEFYRKTAQLYPGSNLADDALLHAGTLLEDILGDKPAAYLAYRQLVDQFPHGDMAGQAARRLERLAAYAPAPQTAKVAPSPARQQAKAGPARPNSRTEVRLSAIRFWSNPGYTRVVLDFSGKSEFSANFLQPDAANGTPPRLYVDIAPAVLGPDMMDPTIVDDGLLRRIRTGRPADGKVRVVMDLDSVSDYKVFPLEDPYRVVIDISGSKQKKTQAAAAPEIRQMPADQQDDIASVLNQAPRPQAPLHVPVTVASNRLRTIVVDAGHGGRDPGAIGPGGTYEKDVTLALAKKLAKELRSTLGCEVILTRDRDVYLPLEERTAIANKVGADLFLSLHANANKSSRPYGIETYYLNFSNNDKAAALAARENGTSLKEVSDLELILFDLMANSKINESSRLAAEIQRNLVSGLSLNYGHIKDMGVRQGPFYVLLGATMPSVLIETAFISNPREEKRLINGTYQDRTSKAIAKAVRHYAEANKMIVSR